MMYTGMTPPRVPFTKTGGGTAVSLDMFTVCLCFRVKAQPSQEQKGIRDLTSTVPELRAHCAFRGTGNAQLAGQAQNHRSSSH